MTPEELKGYGGYIAAERRGKWWIFFETKIHAVSLVAENSAEAIKHLQKMAITIFPFDEGWSNHKVDVTPLSDQSIDTLVTDRLASFYAGTINDK